MLRSSEVLAGLVDRVTFHNGDARKRLVVLVGQRKALAIAVKG